MFFPTNRRTLRKKLIPLDICRKILHNKGINSKLEAWLVFLSSDDPEWIIRLIRKYPQFRTYYEEIYMLCLNTEKVMSMFSKELQELDRNTVQYMIDTMQEEIDKQRQIIGERDAALSEKDREIEELKAKLAQLQ